VNVACEPVELGDDERGAADATRLEHLRELRPVRPLAQLDFGELADQLPIPTIEMATPRGD
jgi:hypothetical protein